MSRFMDVDIKAGRIMRKQDDALEDLYAKERTSDDLLGGDDNDE